MAITVQPVSPAGPATMAVWPSVRRLAPRRSSSMACWNLFSKMPSLMTLMPQAWVMTAITWACRSVGKPG